MGVPERSPKGPSYADRLGSVLGEGTSPDLLRGDPSRSRHRKGGEPGKSWLSDTTKKACVQSSRVIGPRTGLAKVYFNKEG